MYALTTFLLLCSVSVSSQTSFAYVTALFSEDYKTAVEVLGISLRQTGTIMDTVVMVTDSIGEDVRDELKGYGWKLFEVEEMSVNKYSIPKRWRKNLTKLQLWEMTEYHRIIYLDADMIVLKNIDHLFNCPGPICAAMDVPIPIKFNAGLLVLSPNSSIYGDMLQKWNNTSDFSDVEQGFLNYYFHIETMTNILPFKYNAHAYATMRNVMFDTEDVHVIHYTTFKPWIWYSFPLGDLGYIWENLETRLPNIPTSIIPWIIFLSIFPIILVILVQYLARVFYSKEKARTVTLSRWQRTVLSVMFCSCGIYIPFQLIPMRFPYLMGWTLVYEWAAILFWLPLIPELISSFKTGSRFSAPRFHFKMLWWVVLLFAVPLGGLYIVTLYVVMCPSNPIWLRGIVFYTPLFLAFVVSLLLSQVAPHITYHLGKETSRDGPIQFEP